jgi:hypothetical protein
MSTSLTLPDAATAADLATLLGRAARIDEGSVRLIAGSGVLAVYTAVFLPVGLLDDSPTILGLRTFRIAEQEDIDTTVPIASLAARLQSALVTAEPEGSVQLPLPLAVNTVSWAAISPPRGGWSARGTVAPAVLDHVARAGAEEIAATVPDAVGGPILHRARAEVWGRPLRDVGQVPAGAAFAAVALGFVRADDVEPVPVYETEVWTRLTSPRGHVLVKRRASSATR